MQEKNGQRWGLPLIIVAVTIAAVFFIVGRWVQPAKATTQQWQAEGGGQILVVPIQIERDSYGIAMVDTVGQTLWIYELSSRGPVYSRLKLLAARSWRYDRMLQQYNTAEPKPEQVKLLLEELGKTEVRPGRQRSLKADANVAKRDSNSPP